MDNVYGAVIMTQVISRVHSVHLTNAGQRQTAADPQIKVRHKQTFLKQSVNAVSS